MLEQKLKNKNIIFNKNKSSWPSNSPNPRQDILTYKKSKKHSYLKTNEQIVLLLL